LAGHLAGTAQLGREEFKGDYRDDHEEQAGEAEGGLV